MIELLPLLVPDAVLVLENMTTTSTDLHTMLDEIVADQWTPDIQIGEIITTNTLFSGQLGEYYLVDTITEETLLQIQPGDVIDFSLLEDRTVGLYVMANVDLDIDHVKLSLNDGTEAVEKFSPYALFGDDTQGDFFTGQIFENGNYSLEATYVSGDGSIIHSEIVTFSIEESNLPPVVSDITVEVDEDAGFFAVSVASTDFGYDPEGQFISFSSATGAQHGQVTLAGESSILFYTPNDDFFGQEVITVGLWDQSQPESVSTAELIINVVPVDDQTIAVDDEFVFEYEDIATELSEDGFGIEFFAQQDIFANDIDIDTATEEMYLSRIITQPAYGDLTFAGESSIWYYNPHPDKFTGTDTFTYTSLDHTSDGFLESTVGEVSIIINDYPQLQAGADEGAPIGSETMDSDVEESNLPPVVSDITVEVDEDAGFFAVSVASTDFGYDPEGQFISFSSATGAQHGQVTLAGESSILFYTPNDDFFGQEVITVGLWDQSQPESVSTAELIINVVPVDDQTIAVDDEFVFEYEDIATELSEDGFGIEFFAQQDIFANDIDIDTATEEMYLSRIITQPAYGDLTFAGESSIWYYNPHPDKFTGTDTFTYTSLDHTSDGFLESTIGEVSITINDYPGSQTGAEQGTLIKAINIGSDESFTTTDGIVFEADTTGIGNRFENSQPVDNTDADPLYQTEAWTSKSLSYNFHLAAGVYTVNLHFAEIWSGAFQEDGRVFDVILEGNPVEENIDIFSEVGSSTAIVKSYTVEVTDGNLNIDLTKGIQHPKLSALEIYRLPDPAALVD